MGETEPETNNAHLRSCGTAVCLASGRSWADFPRALLGDPREGSGDLPGMRGGKGKEQGIRCQAPKPWVT